MTPKIQFEHLQRDCMNEMVKKHMGFRETLTSLFFWNIESQAILKLLNGNVSLLQQTRCLGNKYTSKSLHLRKLVRIEYTCKI